MTEEEKKEILEMLKLIKVKKHEEDYGLSLEDRYKKLEQYVDKAESLANKIIEFINKHE